MRGYLLLSCCCTHAPNRRLPWNKRLMNKHVGRYDAILLKTIRERMAEARGDAPVVAAASGGNKGSNEGGNEGGNTNNGGGKKSEDEGGGGKEGEDKKGEDAKGEGRRGERSILALAIEAARQEGNTLDEESILAQVRGRPGGGVRGGRRGGQAGRCGQEGVFEGNTLDEESILAPVMTETGGGGQGRGHGGMWTGGFVGGRLLRQRARKGCLAAWSLWPLGLCFVALLLGGVWRAAALPCFYTSKQLMLKHHVCHSCLNTMFATCA